MNSNDLIYVAGHTGMVGSAVVRLLKKEGFNNILTCDRQCLDLRDKCATENFFKKQKPNIVILSAARVGGIEANNTYPAEFLHDNLAIAHNVIHAAWLNSVKRLLFLGSSCIYPKLAPQPILEQSLLTSSLEPTNEAYALAKIVGLKLCQFYRQQYGVTFHSVMPTNLYGLGDNYNRKYSHVIPALIRRFHEAKCAEVKEVSIWGTGKARREFLNVEDLAQGLLILLQDPKPPHWVNIGASKDYTILELAQYIKDAVGFKGNICWDTSKLEGTPRKLLDSRYMIRNYGWSPIIDIQSGLKTAYNDFLKNLKNNTLRVKKTEY